MAILFYTSGTTVVREPANGRFFTRFEKDSLVPGHDTTLFLTDEVSMLACTDSYKRMPDVNAAATDKMRELSGGHIADYLYGPVLLFNNKEFEIREKKKMKFIEIYTDGSIGKNPGGEGGTGWVILVDGQVVKYGGKGYASTTNNRMEMRAVIEAFANLEQLGIAEEEDALTVYSDSQNVILPLTGRWKAHKTLDLWKHLFDIRERYRVRWKWVKGHAGNKYNEMCDQLAVEASCSAGLIKDIGYK